ncbi:MAG: glycosyltransferase [Flavobacteriales bacterium]|nr:MAG: glycosyltransferase [Flavobacteriales bacterium]
MKRVLVITYYWPPNAGVGGQRWLKMCRYLPEHGWSPVVYTPSNPEMAAVDEGLLRDVAPGLEVIKRPITEPFGLYKRFTGRAQDARIQTAFLKEEGSGAPGWKERLALWVRSNLFVPDARVWWVRPSIRYLREYLREHPVDAVVTTGPPHSMHLVGLGLKRALGVRWVADFRDPWTGIDYYQQLSLTRWADARHRRMERTVLASADRVVTVSWRWAKELEALGARDVAVVTNGYDPADLPRAPVQVDEECSLVHAGSMSPTRDQPGLWKLLARLCADDEGFAARFRLRFVGPVDASVIASVNAAGLGAHVERMGHLPRAEAMREIARARVLLLPINTTANQHGILPTKLYEYLSTGRPILAVGPRDGDAARVLGEAHLLLPPTPSATDAARVRALFDAPPVDAAAYARYDRRALAGGMAGVLDGLVANR